MLNPAACKRLSCAARQGSLWHQAAAVQRPWPDSSQVARATAAGHREQPVGRLVHRCPCIVQGHHALQATSPDEWRWSCARRLPHTLWAAGPSCTSSLQCSTGSVRPSGAGTDSRRCDGWLHDCQAPQHTLLKTAGCAAENAGLPHTTSLKDIMATVFCLSVPIGSGRW